MTDTTPLSPAAQAMLKAACIHHGLFNEEIIQRRRMVAAALRAAADQVVPMPRLPYDSCCDVHAAAIRAEILAVAIELEGMQ